MTKRTAIDTFRDELRERNADSNYSNQFLYNVLLNHAKWLIRREVSGGRIYSNTSFFQTLSCQVVIEVPTVDACCPIKTGCKIYRTKEKIPLTWIDTDGPIIKSVSSVDGSTDFFYTNMGTWQSKKNDPYQQMMDVKYTFFADGYLWFPDHNPHLVNIYGFFMDDISDKNGCGEKECTRYLDTLFMVPGWLEGEMFAKALEQVAGITKRLPEDTQIDKNPTRR